MTPRTSLTALVVKIFSFSESYIHDLPLVRLHEHLRLGEEEEEEEEEEERKCKNIP